MKFQKILTVGIGETSLDSTYWEKIDTLTEKRTSLPKESPEILNELTDTDCLLVGFGVPVTEEYLQKATNLKYIGVLATAFGKVDIATAKEKNIVVTNTANYCTEAVAEFTIAVLLESIMSLEVGKSRGRESNYSEAGVKTKEIKNKVFGILGLGTIGSRVAHIAQGFGADVRYWSKNRKPEAESQGIRYEEADHLIAESDFLSLNFSQTSETEKFLNATRIQSLKSGAVVVNTVPMECVDISALCERLAKGDITFILDHSDETPQEDIAKLSQYSNCIIYPPMAYITAEARAAKQTIFIENIESFLRGTPTNKVN